MDATWRQLCARIHAAAAPTVLAVTGGGVAALYELLVVPGASRTVLEAVVPYAAESLAKWLGRAPDRACCEDTALAMSAVAFRRARQLLPSPAALPRLVGVAGTAALATDRPKRGPHRCHLALQTLAYTSSTTLTLTKGARSRPDEDAVVGQVLLAELARAAGVTEIPGPALLGDEQVMRLEERAEPLLQGLWQGDGTLAWSLPSGELVRDLDHRPAGLLSGAFHPLHVGHLQLRDLAERKLGGPVGWEISVRNVDKPPLDYLTLRRRRDQFHDRPLALTDAPTFVEKSALLPHTVFVVGVDTAERIVHPRYYGNSVPALHAALEAIRRHGCRFLVAGRRLAGEFRTRRDLHIPREFQDLFQEVPAEEFRVDVSSTDLRHAAQAAEEAAGE